MAYIVKADFSRLISITLLDEVIAQAVDTSGVDEAQCLTNAIDMAIARVNSFLATKWDMATEFAKAPPVDPAPETRNQNVLRAVIHISIYFLHYTVNPHDIPEMRKQAYTDLVDLQNGELRAVQTGLLSWGLPVKDDTDGDGIPDGTQGTGRTTLYSGRKFISKPFSDPIVTEPEEDDD